MATGAYELHHADLPAESSLGPTQGSTYHHQLKGNSEDTQKRGVDEVENDLKLTS